MAYYEGDPNNGQGQDMNQGAAPEQNGQQYNGQPQSQQQFNGQPQQFNSQPGQQQFNGQPGQQQFQGQQQFNGQPQQQFNGQQQYQQQPYQNYQQPYVNYVDTGHSPTQIMVFGIVSLACGFFFSWTFLLGILSIIFGALSMSWGKKFMEANPGMDNGQVKAGRICGIIGLVLSIIGIVATIIVVAVTGCAACYSYYY